MRWFLNDVRFSPTAYNVFRAYTIGSAYESEGSCVTVTNAPSTLATAFSEQIPQASSAVYLNEDGQQRFLDYLQLTGCSAGGQKVTPIVVAQVQNSTLEITQYQTGGALASATRTLGPVSGSTLLRPECRVTIQCGIRVGSVNYGRWEYDFALLNLL